MTQKQQPYYLVIGLGASGLSMAKFLHSKGFAVKATDIDPHAGSAAKLLETLDIETQIGFHDQTTFNQAAMLIPSPGIPLTSPYIQTALKNGVTLTGELDIYTQYNRLPIVAITGTNGKTTTTTLVSELLTACGKTPFVGGNIGTPLVDQFFDDTAYDIVVAEVSSFQLDISKTFKPQIGLLLNISEDHLDRYDSFNAYAQSKWSLFANQGPKDTAVINASIKDFSKKTSHLKAEVVTFSSDKRNQMTVEAQIDHDSLVIRYRQDMFSIDLTALPQFSGTHNHENLAAAVLACLAVGTPLEGIQKGLKNFKNLAHRMEWVATHNRVDFYNDSKATNTDAVIRALGCFSRPVILVLGGRGKGTDFSLLKPSIQKHVKAIMAIGESKNQIKSTFHNICPVTLADSMEDAVLKGYGKALPDDILMLSPACASFDMYENYAHRGNDFKSIVSRIKEC